MTAVNFDTEYSSLCAKLGHALLQKEQIDSVVAQIRFEIKKLIEAKKSYEEQDKKDTVIAKEETEKL